MKKVSAKMVCYTKRMLKNGIQKNTNLYDDGDPSQCAKSKAVSILTNILWTMCQMIDATIDVDRFFLIDG
jgi:hypothetical protein